MSPNSLQSTLAAQIVSPTYWYPPEQRLIYQVILKYAGHDATNGYAEYHSPSVVKDSLPIECFKGNLDRSTINEEWKQEPVASNVSQAVSDDEKTPLHNIINL